MADELKDVIAENAAGPAKASGDRGSIEGHSLSEQIAADQYLAGRDALASGKNPARFLRRVRITSGGTV